jgi:Fe-S cluster assembly protein SufD
MADTATVERYLTAFEALEGVGDRTGPAWLHAARRTAIGRFAAMGLPTRRDEDWKYTSVAAIAETPFRITPNGAAERVTEALLALSGGPAPSWVRLVFVNGRYAAKLSAVRPLPGGVQVGRLAEALITDAALVEAHLGRYADAVGDGFTALNTAFVEDGAFVHVPAGVAVAEPIQLVFVATSPDGPVLAQPRSLIVLGRSSEATLVERYVTVGGGMTLTNAVTEVALGEGAACDHVKIERESGRAFHVGRTQVHQARDSRFTSCSVALGAQLARSDVHVVLDGEGGSAALSGLYVVGGRRHVDTHTVVDHAKPRCTSRQLYKGVLDGSARGVFYGRIIVRPDAQKTDAHQANKNLLLGDGAEVDSKPQLEIFADDVKCSHGAADGQLADDALFYLRSRGLSDAAARALLTYGFASEVVSRIRIEPIRAQLQELLSARLRTGRLEETP